MRVLVVNGAVSSVQRRSGEAWQELRAYMLGPQLYAVSSEDVIDYDIFVLDQEKIDYDNTPQAQARPIGQQIVERVSGGGCAVFFMGEQKLSWLPIPLSPVPFSGRELNIPNDEDPLRTLVERFRTDASYRSQFDVSQGWELIATAKNGRPVAAKSYHGAGLFIVLPEFKSRPKVLRELLDRVLPVLLPDLARPSSPAASEEAPDWIADFRLPKVDELEQGITQIEAQIAELREQQDQKDRERLELLEYRGLLWLDGFPLERAVAVALNLLGVPVHPQAPVDLVHTKEDGSDLYIEVEGTDTLVQLRKGQQLLSYIADSDDPASVSGAIIGNPYRKRPPNDRPTEPEQLYSAPLRRLADGQRWRLVTTVELFELVQGYLGEDLSASARARKILGL